VRLVENGVDPSLFRPQCAATPDDIAAISGPRIGFVGSVLEPLIDLGMMAAMAARRPGWSFCLVGWYDHDDAGIAALRALPNVHVLGPRPRERLSAYLSAMDVLTCPYPACDVTAVASPLKVYEALAVGVPLVALHAPTIEHLAPHVRNTDSIEAFEATLAEMLTSPPEPDAEVLRSVAWASRAETFRGHVVDALEG
jgi:glycosyltransferase involved in cell wall biosynthesis